MIVKGNKMDSVTVSLFLIIIIIEFFYDLIRYILKIMLK